MKFKEIYDLNNILRVLGVTLLIMLYEYVEHGKIPGSDGLDKIAFKVVFMLILMPPVLFSLDKAFGENKKRK